MHQHPDGPPHHEPRAAHWALADSSEAVAQARDHVREFLVASRPTTQATLHDSLLVVSELVTNAVLYAPGPSVLHVAYEDGTLAIAVSDTSPQLPTSRIPDPTSAAGGFGWHLLTSLACRIDVQRHADGGKTITALLRDTPATPLRGRE